MKKLFVLLVMVMCFSGCGVLFPYSSSESASGLKKATVTVNSGVDGLSTEQRNIVSRLTQDNTVGAIQHLYIVSAITGDCILYSTVDGKVTSSGKRLTPETISSQNGTAMFRVRIGNNDYYTTEVMNDDGSYGSGNVPYIYWKDTKGVYHQFIKSDIAMVLISTQPKNFKKVILNLNDM